MMKVKVKVKVFRSILVYWIYYDIYIINVESLKNVMFEILMVLSAIWVKCNGNERRSFFLQKPEIHPDGEIGRSLMISWFGEALLVTSLQQSSFSSSCHHQCHQCHHPANNVLVIKYFVTRRISVAQLAHQPISPSWGWAGINIYQ